MHKAISPIQEISTNDDTLSLSNPTSTKPPHVPKVHSISDSRMPLEETNSISNHDAQSMTVAKQINLMLFCVQFISFIHRCSACAAGLVIPYYVLSTPEHGWTVSDLSVIFALLNVGGITASQICMVAGKFPKRGNTILFMGHCLQFTMGFVGYVIMSSFFGFNKPLFYLGAFLNGFCKDHTTIQAYGPLVSDNEETQKRMLAKICRVVIGSGIINSFLLPALYANAGFQAFCAVISVLSLVALAFLFVMWSLIVRNKKHVLSQSKSQTKDDARNPVVKPPLVASSVKVT